MDDRRRLEEVQETLSTLGWRYVQEELLAQIENIKEAMLYIESEAELFRMQGQVAQIAVILNLPTETEHLLRALDSEGEDSAAV